MADPQETVRLAAFGDIHYGPKSSGTYSALFASLAEVADIVAICGDLTVHGLAEEARILAQDLKSVIHVPILAVLGNHDYEAGEPDVVQKTLTDAGIVVLNGEAHVVRGIGFAGAKGFCGGFGKCLLAPWGEPAIKTFVGEAVEETLRLEAALAKLRTPTKVVLLHYAPIRGTVEGEPPEIFAFLGSSRLEDPINRYEVSVVLHGHAHHGRPEGRTSADIPVYNVAMPVLRQLLPDEPAFRVIDLASAAGVEEESS